jgi:hypothetical protein
MARCELLRKPAHERQSHVTVFILWQVKRLDCRILLLLP